MMCKTPWIDEPTFGELCAMFDSDELWGIIGPVLAVLDTTLSAVGSDVPTGIAGEYAKRLDATLTTLGMVGALALQAEVRLVSAQIRASRAPSDTDMRRVTQALKMTGAELRHRLGRPIVQRSAPRPRPA